MSSDFYPLSSLRLQQKYCATKGRRVPSKFPPLVGRFIASTARHQSLILDLHLMLSFRHLVAEHLFLLELASPSFDFVAWDAPIAIFNINSLAILQLSSFTPSALSTPPSRLLIHATTRGRFADHIHHQLQIFASSAPPPLSPVPVSPGILRGHSPSARAGISQDPQSFTFLVSSWFMKVMNINSRRTHLSIDCNFIACP
ncbi:hypothetical protein R3P38DRAFT_3274949 [Favolaschia claudopus]|uniref:Uncharacterized protein n=1 Tax=Favolaschia claudopus TaxID=2862362 RepID=A0AAW0AWD2_9AGAR